MLTGLRLGELHRDRKGKRQSPGVTQRAIKGFGVIAVTVSVPLAAATAATAATTSNCDGTSTCTPLADPTSNATATGQDNSASFALALGDSTANSTATDHSLSLSFAGRRQHSQLDGH